MEEVGGSCGGEWLRKNLKLAVGGREVVKKDTRY